MTTIDTDYEIKKVSSDGSYKTDAEIYDKISGYVENAKDAIEKIQLFRDNLKLKVKINQDSIDVTTPYLKVGDTISNGSKPSSITYTIKDCLYDGGFGITYLADNGEGITRVIKEFCPDYDNLGRYKDSCHLNFNLVELPDKEQNKKINDKVKLNKKLISKFIEEPKRLDKYFKDLEDKGITPDKERMNIVFCTPANAFIDGKNGNLYYAMSQVIGETLEKFISKKKNLPFALSMDIMKNLIEGVRPLHDINIVHQDLSHSNVMINVDEKDSLISLKVIDLGSAFDCSKTATNNSFIPTRTNGFTESQTAQNDYISKNIALGKYMDIYSLGVILFYLFFYEKILEKTVVDEKTILDVLESCMNSELYLDETIQTSFNSNNIELNTQLRMVVQLVKDATSLDRTNGTNPFHQRPDSLDKFKERLEAIERVSTAIDKLNVTVTNDQNKGVKIDNLTINQIVEYSKDNWFDIELDNNKVIVIPNSANPDTENIRSGILVICDDNNQLYCVTVTQTAATLLEWHEDNSLDELEIPFVGGTKNMYIKTNKAWTAKVDADWVGLKTLDGAAGNKVVCELNPKRNTLDTDRKATLTITCTEDGSFIEKVLKQATKLPYIKIKNDGGLTSVGYGETHKKTVTFSTNFDWKAKVEYKSDEKDWIVLDKDNGTPKENSLDVKLSTNLTVNERKATIILTANGATTEINVSQTGCPQKPKESEKPIEPVKSEDIKLIEKKILSNGNIEVTFDATSNWQVDKKSLPGWIKVTPNNGLKGKNKLTIKPDVNKGGARQTTILVVCADKSISVPVEQNGKPSNTKWWVLAVVLLACVGWLGLRPVATSSEPALRLMNMSDKELQVSYNAEDLYIAFEAGDKWKCEVLPADADWLSVDKTAGAAGQTTLTAAVKTNRKFNNRQANILLTCGDTSLTLLVNQGYDKVDSLQQNLGGVEFSPFFQAVDEAGNPITFKGEDLDFDKLIKNQYPDYRIGITHDIVNYEKDKKNRISKLIMKAK